VKRLNAMIDAYVPGARASWYCSTYARKDGWSLLSFRQKADQTNLAQMWNKAGGGAVNNVHIFPQQTGIIYFDCRGGKIQKLNQIVRDWRPATKPGCGNTPLPRIIPAPPARITKYTSAFGGNGGGSINSYCPDGHYINWWKIRTGSLVDRIQGRCSNGTWLRVCGGSGGGESQKAGVWGAHKMYVRTGALVDQFNGRGGNGGGAHWLDCGSGFKITGYQLRCGSLVDKVRFQCKNV